MSLGTPPQDAAVSNLKINETISGSKGVFGKTVTASLVTDVVMSDVITADTLYLSPPPAPGYILQAADSSGLVEWVAPTPVTVLPDYYVTQTYTASPSYLLFGAHSYNVIEILNSLDTIYQAGNPIEISGTDIHLNNTSIGDTYTLQIIIVINSVISDLNSFTLSVSGDATMSTPVEPVPSGAESVIFTVSNLTPNAVNAVLTFNVAVAIFGGGSSAVRGCFLSITKNIV